MHIWFPQLHGVTQEVYSVNMPKSLRGKPFSECVLHVYHEYDLTLVGLLLSYKGHTHVVLNPGSTYKISVM